MKESIIKYTMMAVVALALIITLGITMTSLTGCVHYPKLEDMPKGSPDSCLRYERCLYYNSKSKNSIDCAKALDSCDKNDVWDDCLGELPENINFQECWDKKR